jgi:RHS repeat-associated protein
MGRSKSGCTTARTGGGDVSVLLTDTGTVLEWVKYLAYGRQFGHPGGDLDGNGHSNVDDATELVNLMGTGGYRITADVNLDGDADADDLDFFTWGSMGWGTLSLVGNRFGYAGYQHAPELAGTVWEARNRWLDSVTGVWSRRDPLGYVDGMNLYQYVRGMALVWVDPTGAIAVPCASATGCGGGVSTVSSLGLTHATALPPGQMGPPEDEGYFCARMCARFPAAVALAVSFYGSPRICFCRGPGGNEWERDMPTRERFGKCVFEYESRNFTLDIVHCPENWHGPARPAGPVAQTACAKARNYRMYADCVTEIDCEGDDLCDWYACIFAASANCMADAFDIACRDPSIEGQRRSIQAQDRCIAETWEAECGRRPKSGKGSQSVE